MSRVKRSVPKRMDRILVCECDTSAEKKDLAERACIAVVGTTPLRAPKHRRSGREPKGEHNGNVEADYEAAPLLISDHFGLLLDYRPPAVLVAVRRSGSGDQIAARGAGGAAAREHQLGGGTGGASRQRKRGERVFYLPLHFKRILLTI